ncbi:ABC transporter permease subunit [Ureibacillus acetophenoni]|uniref:ABC-2 family transporter n=1 Tax=Ureibacillus acetophenoni TaxID=614649 RepID=A0A285UED3_9BACL|nr:ABC transporter permease subunit [Ureibacillus acetophenoni]SOC40037.1 ABC-2 family transporter [Ureibacillus acetophenoni]
MVSKAIIRKDIIDITRSKTLLTTLIVIPIVFSVFFPLLIMGSALLFDIEKVTGSDLNMMLDKFVSVMDSSVAAYSVEQQIVYIFINYLLPTFFLLVPIITAMTVAANSFVGEKERRTLESLLLSPISIKDLYLSKIIASIIPPLFVSIISFVISGVIINALGYPIFSTLIFPSTNWIVLICCLSPMIILLVVLVNILISSKVKTYQEAQNIAGVVVLPIVALIIGQISGLFLLGVELILILSGVLLVINFVILYRISKFNDRPDLFEKQIH